jgi:hypothetical protein
MQAALIATPNSDGPNPNSQNNNRMFPISQGKMGLLSIVFPEFEIRRGLSVIFGCFLLFGAREIARDLRSAALSETIPVSANVPPPPPFAKPPSAANAPSGYDPYAGASVKRNGE